MLDYSFKVVPVRDVRGFIEEHHYSKSINGVKISHCFAIYSDEQLVGTCLFGQLSTTAWKKFGDSEADVLELRRLVTLDSCKKNTESWFISKCIAWLIKNTNVKILVSYADPMYGHVGYVYQASNWSYVGQTPKDKGYVDKETGKKYHSRALRTKYKGEYKPFVKILREKLSNGMLDEIILEGKHCYCYFLRKKNNKRNNYPKIRNQSIEELNEATRFK